MTLIPTNINRNNGFDGDPIIVFGPLDIESFVGPVFDDEGFNNLYREVHRRAALSMRNIPGATPNHYAMVERAAYLYVKSIEAHRDPSQPYYVAKAWTDAYGRIVTELGRETRTLTREEGWKNALIQGIISILRQELEVYPELLRKVISRLENL